MWIGNDPQIWAVLWCLSTTEDGIEVPSLKSIRDIAPSLLVLLILPENRQCIRADHIAAHRPHFTGWYVVEREAVTSPLPDLFLASCSPGEQKWVVFVFFTGAAVVRSPCTTTQTVWGEAVAYVFMPEQLFRGHSKSDPLFASLFAKCVLQNRSISKHYKLIYATYKGWISLQCNMAFWLKQRGPCYGLCWTKLTC